ncbi:MAG: hypothetical protein OXU69_14690 [Gemmatimonadota bacterium]|nr:hypothetical protein [Gemmatimonadota bacterium]MDE2985948.1 hypothetical protein [Gemmatimonadota bacterium]
MKKLPGNGTRMGIEPEIPPAGCPASSASSNGRASRRPSAPVLALLMAGVGGWNAQPAPAQQVEIDSTGVRRVTIDPSASDAMCSLGEEPTFSVGDDEDHDELWFSRVLGVARLSDGSVAVADDQSREVRNLRRVRLARPFDGTGG